MRHVLDPLLVQRQAVDQRAGDAVCFRARKVLFVRLQDFTGVLDQRIRHSVECAILRVGVDQGKRGRRGARALPDRVDAVHRITSESRWMTSRPPSLMLLPWIEGISSAP